MSYHDPTSLKPFFKRHGLKIRKVSFNEAQGSSLRFYVVHERAEGSEYLGFGEPFPMMSALSTIIQVRGAALREALSKLFQREEMVCIYGAPAKLTTLLYATSLHSWPFNCVGDDNPRKVGLTTPGNHIPIVSVEEMLARKPDTILVASWNFFDDIRDRLRAAGFKGGIINPMQGDG
jgi:hypothetical protein